MNNLINSISEKRFYFIILLIILYIIFNFFGGDRGLIEYFKKKSLLKEFQEKNLEIKKEIIFFTRKNDFLSVNINKDYLDEIYRDFFVLGKKGEKIYIINQKWQLDILKKLIILNIQSKKTSLDKSKG